MSGKQRLAPSTVHGYHLTLRMFCDYLSGAHYDWPRQCRERFGQVPVQVCHEWNTVAHLKEYEGRMARRPLTDDELQVLFDYLDERVARVTGSGRKGALRDAQMIKTAYAFRSRRNELCRLDGRPAAEPGGARVGRVRLWHRLPEVTQPGRLRAAPHARRTHRSKDSSFASVLQWVRPSGRCRLHSHCPTGHRDLFRCVW